MVSQADKWITLHLYDGGSPVAVKVSAICAICPKIQGEGAESEFSIVTDINGKICVKESAQEVAQKIGFYFEE